MDRIKIILSVLLLVSAVLNARFFTLFSDSHDDFVVSMSESMRYENQVLQHLTNNEVGLAKTELTDGISTKALYIGVCIENGCASKKALAKLHARPPQPR
jgi:hypothetical protein